MSTSLRFPFSGRAYAFSRLPVRIRMAAAILATSLATIPANASTTAPSHDSHGRHGSQDAHGPSGAHDPHAPRAHGAHSPASATSHGIDPLDLGAEPVAADPFDGDADHAPAAVSPLASSAAHGAPAKPASAAGHGTAPAAKKAQAPAATATHGASAAHGPSDGISPGDALTRLREGNARFAEGHARHSRQDALRRSETGQGQRPFAVIVGCADSRVPPEILFDQGLGDLFVIRAAGQVLEYPGLASIEYALSHLGTRLVVVLGHERCGAVGAARQTLNAGPGALDAVPGDLKPLIAAILPAVSSVRDLKGESMTPAVEANAHRVADQIRGSWPVIAPLVHRKDVAVVPAVYDLESGKVRFLE